MRISKTLIDPEIELIKANATLIDGSILFVNEATGENWREYSYHWQKDGKMIMRWDNAPHHKDLVNFESFYYLLVLTTTESTEHTEKSVNALCSLWTLWLNFPYDETFLQKKLKSL